MFRLAGKPICLLVDNGPEFTIKRFNRSYRKENLNAYLIFNLSEVREHTQAWINIITTDPTKGW